MGEFEEVIEDWYRNHQEEDLSQFLCANHVLKGKDTSEFLFQGLGFQGLVNYLNARLIRINRSSFTKASGDNKATQEQNGGGILGKMM